MPEDVPFLDPRHFFHGAVPIYYFLLPVDDKGGVRKEFDNVLKFPVGSLKSQFGLFTFGYVPYDAYYEFIFGLIRVEGFFCDYSTGGPVTIRYLFLIFIPLPRFKNDFILFQKDIDLVFGKEIIIGSAKDILTLSGLQERTGRR